MPGKNLARSEARQRAALVSALAYVVDLDLTVSESVFSVDETLTFTAEPGSSTFLDFIGESVEEVTINGETREVEFADHRIQLRGLAADNTVRIRATARYTNTGEGLHRLVDPVDGEAYLYSQFEVADSRRVFPCFEQPDEKATFTFSMIAPAHWQILSNSPTPEPEPVREGVARWSFAATPRISTYITAVVAGPYDVVRDTVSTRAGEIPLGIYCRKSMREYLDPEEIFALTKAGFAFYEEEFDQPYPFAKYDQIFTPEYNMGAMENAGCVTLNEIYVFRGRVTDAIRERRALTILHELAHMWFGNLVTMRWWDDLWLNESFAEWTSTTAMAEATRYEEAWTTFCAHEKTWAYDQDQRSSTHPVVADMRDLHDVEVNFDGITYAKGASVLKQLVAYVGRDAFRDGLRAYFRKHAWGNTTLRDLLDELEATSGRDLTTWSALWLETAGVGTLRPVLTVGDDATITEAHLEQTVPAAYPTLRPHRLAIGLYAVTPGPDGDTLTRTDRFELDVDGERTELPQLVGRARPALLLVNDDDLAYTKVRLDETSLATALAHPRGFSDSLARSLVLQTLWDMTREAEMPARDFLHHLLAVLPGEQDSTLLRVLTSQLLEAVNTYTDPATREERRTEMLAEVWRLAREAEAGSDAQLQLVNCAASLTRKGDDPAYLAGLLDGSEVLEGLAVDTEMRWTLLTALAAAGAADEAEVDAERRRDDTATGRERAARALASRPTAEAKADAWRAAVEEEGLPNAVVEMLGLGFARAGDPDLLRPFVDRYVGMLDQVGGKDSHAILETIVTVFYPGMLAEESLLGAVQGWIDTHPDADEALVRLVAENRDATARALAAQARDREAS